MDVTSDVVPDRQCIADRVPLGLAAVAGDERRRAPCLAIIWRAPEQQVHIAVIITTVFASLDESEHACSMRDFEQCRDLITLVGPYAWIVVARAPQVGMPFIWCQATGSDMNFTRSRDRNKRKHCCDHANS